MKNQTSTQQLERSFRYLYDSLSLDVLPCLPNVYHPDVLFIDPVGEHKGLPHLTQYFEKLLQGNSSCDFNIWDMHLGEYHGFAIWTMHFTTPHLAGGSPISVDGASSIRLKDGLISFQRDHYDMGAMVYEHVPVLGSVLRYIRRRMSA